MKMMITSVSKIFGILIVCEVLLFIGMVITAMTDDKPPLIGEVFYWVLKYLFGFPFVLINNNYPFFLDSSYMPKIVIVLIILNNIILALIILGIKKIFNKV